MASGIPLPTVDQSGMSVPTYDDVHTWLRDTYRNIYGQDIYIEPDSQDGEFLAILALAFHDFASVSLAVYNSFSPSTAQGMGLSRVTKINGIHRKIPTYSTVDVKLVGQAGVTINAGVVGEQNTVQTAIVIDWLLPSSVTIPPEGEITVTAVAQQRGAYKLQADRITWIKTPTAGWQSVTNPTPSIPGAAIETDAQLRGRQTISTEIPSQTLFEGILGAVAAIEGVTRFGGYENAEAGETDEGLPGHSITIFADGGDDVEIARTIFQKKAPGTTTFGDTLVTIFDEYGIPHAIRFVRPTQVRIKYNIVVKPLPKYSAKIEQKIKDSLVAWTNNLRVGEDVVYTKVFVPANLMSDPDTETFEIQSLTIGREGDTASNVDIVLSYNEAAMAEAADITVGSIQS
jgi:uncharacterized phage protein gp47/JayE